MDIIVKPNLRILIYHACIYTGFVLGSRLGSVLIRVWRFHVRKIKGGKLQIGDEFRKMSHERWTQRWNTETEDGNEGQTRKADTKDGRGEQTRKTNADDGNGRQTRKMDEENER